MGVNEVAAMILTKGVITRDVKGNKRLQRADTHNTMRILTIYPTRRI